MAAAVVVAAGIQAAAWLVGPVFLALVIVLTVHPIHERMRRAGLPPWAATTVLVLLVYAVLVVLVGVIIVSVARLATILPAYAGNANALLASVTARLAEFGVGIDQLRTISASLNYGRLVSVASGLLLGLTSVLGNLVFLLSLLLFLSIEASGTPARLAMVAATRAPIAEALGRFASSTRRYVAVAHRAGGRDRAGAARDSAGAAVGPAGVHHQLHPVHRVLDRAGATRAAGPVDRRVEPDARRRRAVHGGQLRAHFAHPAQVRRRRRRHLGDGHPGRAGLLGLARSARSAPCSRSP